MSFDLFTIHSVARELDEKFAGGRIERAGFFPGQGRDAGKLSERKPALALACGRDIHLSFELGARGFVGLHRAGLSAVFSVHGTPERYLQGAAVDSVQADRRDRVLKIRLSRDNQRGEKTYGQLLVELIPPRVQAILVSERSQSIKGIWPIPDGAGQGRALREGGTYAPPGKTRLLPGEDCIDRFAAALARELRKQEEALPRALQRTIAGADRGVAAELLFRAGFALPGVETDSPRETIDDALVGRLWSVGDEMFAESDDRTRTGGFLFTEGGRLMVSSLCPRRPVEDLRRFDSILSALGEWRANRERTEVRKGRLRARPSGPCQGAAPGGTLP